jgi:hypothetical protein
VFKMDKAAHPAVWPEAKNRSPAQGSTDRSSIESTIPFRLRSATNFGPLAEANFGPSGEAEE